MREFLHTDSGMRDGVTPNHVSIKLSIMEPEINQIQCGCHFVRGKIHLTLVSCYRWFEGEFKGFDKSNHYFKILLRHIVGTYSGLSKPI